MRVLYIIEIVHEYTLINNKSVEKKTCLELFTKHMPSWEYLWAGITINIQYSINIKDLTWYNAFKPDIINFRPSKMWRLAFVAPRENSNFFFFFWIRHIYADSKVNHGTNTITRCEKKRIHKKKQYPLSMKCILLVYKPEKNVLEEWCIKNIRR